MTIVVCPLSKVSEMVAAHRPARVISLLDPEWDFPDLGEAYHDRHLRLSLHDVSFPAEYLVVPSAGHIGDLLRFLGAWDPTQPLLIHCRAGISRSTATAFIAACYVNPAADEYEIAVALRRAAPLARPNTSLIALADRAMGRAGRMIQAIEDTGRDLPWPEVEEGEPFRLSLPRAS